MSKDLPPPTDEPTGPAPDEIGAASMTPPSGADAVLPPERQLDENRDEQTPDEIALTLSPQQMAVASTFYEVSLPGGMIGLYDTLFRTLQLHGESSPFNGGPMTEINGIEYSAARRLRSGDAESDDDDDDDMYVEFAEQRRHEREEREAWARENHSLGNVTMTGKEWGELADFLEQNPRFKEELIQRLMRDGRDRQAAEKKANEMIEVYRIMAKPESQWTEEERRKVDAAKTDPDFLNQTHDVAEAMKNQRQGVSYGAVNRTETLSTGGERDNSLAARSGALDDQPFQGAPDVSADFSAVALPPTASPDPVAPVPSPDAVQPPPQIAAAPPPPLPGGSGGFDMSS